MAFQGTLHHDAREVNGTIDAVGGELNAYTVRESTSFYARVPYPAQDLAADLLCELVATPRLDPGDVESEREVILEELSAALDDPDDVAHMTLAESIFGDHPLGRETLGTRESLEAITPESLREHHAVGYCAANVVVAAAGRVDHDRLVETAAKWFGGDAAVADGTVTPRLVARSPITDALGPDVVIRKPIEQAHLAIGWRCLPALHPDRYALAVLVHILGDGPSSRLFRIIRDERGLAYSIDAGSSAYSDAGSFVVSTASAPRRVDEIRKVIADEIADLADVGPTSDELAMAVGYLSGATVLALEDAASRMARLGGGELVGRVVPVADTLAAIEAVDADAVRRLATEVLLAPSTSVVVGPRR